MSNWTTDGLMWRCGECGVRRERGATFWHDHGQHGYSFPRQEDLEWGVAQAARLIGPGFHPDNRGADYVPGLPEPLTAEGLDALLETAVRAGLDVYAVTLDVFSQEGWVR